VIEQDKEIIQKNERVVNPLAGIFSKGKHQCFTGTGADRFPHRL